MRTRLFPRLSAPHALALAAACALSVPAFAQDGDEDIPELEDEDESEPDAPRSALGSDEDEASTDDPPSAGSGGDAPAADAPVAEGNIQTIYAVQGKQRLVAGSFEIAPQIAFSISDRFTSHTGLILSGIYHLKENVAVEVSAGGFFWWDDPGGANDSGPRLGGRDTDMTVELRQKERLAPELVQLYRLTWLTTADLQWSPIYGKVAVQGVQLGQFNLYLSVGAGFTGLQLENQQALGEFYDLPGLPGIGPVSLTTTFGGGLRFYFGDFIGVRFEIRDYVNALSVLPRDVSSEPFATFDVTNTLLAQAGVSFIF